MTVVRKVVRTVGSVLALLLLATGCRSATGDEAEVSLVRQPSTTAVATSGTPATKAVPTTASTVPQRPVHEQAWTPFARVGDVVLVHPSRRVERIGYHESNIDGAGTFDPLPGAAASVTLESRNRDTSPRGAADIVVDPDVEIRSPVTGKVRYAGTYVLYCDHRDDFVIINPDARPNWEVKVLHISGVAVKPGDRVVAGETVLAPRPTRLPFPSQVEETAFSPPWPHVHMEVIDPSIPDRPSGRGC